MKTSIYNFFIKIDKGKYVVYNTLANSMAAIGKKLKDSLEKFDESSCIDSKIIEDLKKLGVLIDDYIDEKKIIKYEYENAKYNSDFSIFTILTTYACNLGCPYCYEGKGEILNASMSEEIIDLVTKFIKKEVYKNHTPVIEIVLYGGEPLLNSTACFNLLDKIQPWAKERSINLRVRIVTNGTLLTEKIAEKLLNYDFVNVQITLHGSKKVHDKIRIFKDGSPTYNRIMSTLSLLKKTGIFVSLCVNVDKENINTIDELLNDLKKRNFQDIPIGFSPVLPVTRVCQDYSLMCIPESQMKAVFKLRKLAKGKGFVSIRRGSRRSYCNALAKNSYVIDPLRDVYKCWNLVGQKEHRVGVIDEKGDFKPTYEYYDILSRDPFQIKECRDCKILPLCWSGCISRAYFRYNTYHARGCYGEKFNIKEMIKVYLAEKHPEIVKEDFNRR